MNRGAAVRGVVAALVLLVACSRPAWRRHPQPVQKDTRSLGAAEAPPRHATPDDIHVFDSYIGRFSSKKYHDEASGARFHYLAHYEWFDTNRTIVKFTISTVKESDGTESVRGQGFYGYDPFEERLYVFGVFTAGSTGFGSVGEFDRETHGRTTWARSKAPDGTTIHVRDSFEMMDEDRWKDVTSIRMGDDGVWKVVYEDVFTRIEE